MKFENDSERRTERSKLREVGQLTNIGMSVVA